MMCKNEGVTAGFLLFAQFLGAYVTAPGHLLGLVCAVSSSVGSPEWHQG